MTEAMRLSRRITLGLWWALFCLLWVPGTALVLVGIGIGACGGDGGQPNAAPGSPLGHYCGALPSFEAKPLLILIPVVGAAAVMVSGERRVLIALVAVLSLATLMYLGIPAALPD
jgi:hypothetical protein